MGPLLPGIHTAIYTRRSLQLYHFSIIQRLYVHSVVALSALKAAGKTSAAHQKGGECDKETS